MLLLNDIRIKIVVVILILFSSTFWPINLPSSVFFLCIISYLAALKYSQLKVIQGIFLGLIITSLHITYYQNLNKSLYSQGHDITIKGEIQSLIAFKETTSSILVQVTEFNSNKFLPNFSPLVRLSIRDFKKQLTDDTSILFKQGEIWQFDVSLRPPIGRHNEVGYKLEGYALSKGIHAYGKIKAATRLMPSTSYRSNLFIESYNKTISYDYQSLLLALTFGYKGGIAANEWQILRNSGLAHLIAISGLHIGFVYGIGWFVGRGFRSLNPTHYHVWLPVLFGGIFATTYAWLADFSLPTIRALIACFLVSILLILRIKWPKHLFFLWCLLLCLVINPFSSLSMSFWLSFCAVSVVLFSLYIYQKIGTDKLNGRVKKVTQVVFIQFGLFTLLIPIQGYFFSGISYLSPFINLIAVPWVSLFTVPLSLVAAAFDMLSLPISSWFWKGANGSLKPIWWLAKQAEHSWLLLPTVFNQVIIFILILLMLKLFMPLKALVNPLFMLLICAAFIRPDKKWQIDFLDVGHGLAVLIEANDKTIIYDTGMKWSNGSIAESVIEPILHRRGIQSITGLILSHLDNDHAGGKDYLIERFTPNWVRTSEISDITMPCIQGEKWREGSIEFEVLWPPKLVKRAYNPHSCVIKLDIDKWTFLLTGDIDAISEMLILNQNDFSSVDIILVPHHGSTTSSTDRWVNTMKNKTAIVSTGRFSPWNLPSKQIKQKYSENNITWLDTAQSGQISLYAINDKLHINRYSEVNQNVWYRKLFGDNLNSE
ncbi:DNA internalization-related competence protein ComEC/Rec2 [Aliivibrio fischeri]|uniref:DNA internalization-related competence protein ComEC/Rec2 n=1 Tax=Aliivibrio fischeri TaxID=668 RepID=UPI001F33464F|nr:DNA internalization-related competence protein ComEC/Rec2 [Aliivibrio fischeri]MCE7578532.1 DNA internalization-related competence protein ComEC/Rec2 [Aliivibrio fischeri]MCE7590766.1 DNA internalization-related competence protein ComEC/Rec2 [Aliivibrio fischeri]